MRRNDGRIAGWRRALVVPIAVACVALVGCGDPETGDARGYTKAPLERPGVFIDGEEATDMVGLREPLLPPVLELQPSDTVGTG